MTRQSTSSPSSEDTRPSRPVPDAALSAQERELLDRIARQIERWRLAPLALFLLEAHRPLEFFTGQAVVFAAPLLGCFLPRARVDGLADLLSRRLAIDGLIDRLEKRRPDGAELEGEAEGDEAAIGE